MIAYNLAVDLLGIVDFHLTSAGGGTKIKLC